VGEAFSTVYRRVMPDLPRNPWVMPAPAVVVTAARTGAA
jgi:hypothetical protein